MLKVLFTDKNKLNGHSALRYNPYLEPNTELIHFFFSDRQNFDGNIQVINSFKDINAGDKVIFPIIYTEALEIFEDKFISLVFTDTLISAISSTDFKLYILLWIPSEGFLFRIYTNSKVVDGFNKLIEQTKIPPDKILMCYGDNNISKTVDRLVEKGVDIKIPSQNFFSFEHFLYISSRNFIDRNINYPNIQKKLSKHGVIKFGNLRLSRLYFLTQLNKKNLLNDKFLYSVLDQSNLKRKMTKPESYEVFTLMTKDKDFDYKSIYDEYRSMVDSFPIELDVSAKTDAGIVNKPIFPREINDKVAFEFVIDSEPDLYNYGINYLTEKVFNPMGYRIPFLIAGSSNTYKTLHQLGFKTFPELFDESFDKVENIGERFDRLFVTLENFLNLPLSSVEKIINSRQIQDKLDHNYNLLMKYSSSPSNIIKIITNKIK